MPNSMPSFRKFLRAVFEKSCHACTDARTEQPDSICPFGFQPGPIKAAAIKKLKW